MALFFKVASIVEEQMNLANLRQKEQNFAKKLQINPSCYKMDEEVFLDCLKLIGQYNLNLNRFDLCKLIEERKNAKLLKSDMEMEIVRNSHLTSMNTPSTSIFEGKNGGEKIMANEEKVEKRAEKNFDLDGKKEHLFWKKIEENEIFENEEHNFTSVLLNYSHYPDKDFANAAIRSLLKRINCRPNQINQFVKIIISHGEEKCSKNCMKIKIPRDRRLQIRGKKFRPHLLFAKIFRWPNLQNGKMLKAAPFCQFSYFLEENSDLICVNPYHYEKVENNEMSGDFD